jgi:hypothetical protein
MELKDFATDPKKEIEGVWVEDGDGAFKLGRLNTTVYFDYLAKLREPYLKTAKRGAEIAKEAAEEIYNRAMAHCILLDWKNFTVNGRQLPYSEETAFKVLSSKYFKPFRDRVSGLASQLTHFAIDNLEEIESDLFSSSDSKAP